MVWIQNFRIYECRGCNYITGNNCVAPTYLESSLNLLIPDFSVLISPLYIFLLSLSLYFSLFRSDCDSAARITQFKLHCTKCELHFSDNTKIIYVLRTLSSLFIGACINCINFTLYRNGDFRLQNFMHNSFAFRCYVKGLNNF